MDDYYVYLRSGGSNIHNPLNSYSMFTNYLAGPIELDSQYVWEVGICELHLPLKGRKEILQRLVDEARLYNEHADETVRFAEEMVNDAQKARDEAMLLKTEADEGMERARELHERAEQELKRVEKESELLNVLTNEHNEKVRSHRREAEAHAEQRGLLENALRDFEKEKDRLERQSEGQERVSLELIELRTKITADRAALELLIAAENQRERNAEADLKRCRLELATAQDRFARAEQVLQDTLTQLRELQNRLGAFKPASTPPPPQPLPKNVLQVGSSTAEFPAYTHFDVKSFLKTVLVNVPRVFQSLMAGELHIAAERVYNSLPYSGTNPKFKYCGAISGPINRIRVSPTEICFPVRRYRSAEDLINEMVIKGCHYNSQARTIAMEVMTEVEHYFSQATISIGSGVTLSIPHRTYQGMGEVHERILRRLDTKQEKEAYALSVHNAIESDKILKLVSIIPSHEGGFVFVIKSRNTSVTLPVKDYPSMTDFIAQLRAGITADQRVVDSLLSSWQRSINPLLPTRGGRARRSVQTNILSSPFDSDLILVKSCLIGLQYFGDSMTRVLRVLPYPFESGVSHVTFNNVYYFPVTSHWIRSIRIELCDGNGRSFPDSYFGGECVVLLHLRKSHECRPVNSLLPSTG